MYLVFLNLIINVGCSKDDESASNWGIEEPLITSGSNSHLLTKYHSTGTDMLSINDKLMFNNKYEDQKIKLNITSTCNNNIQQFNIALKSLIYIKELIPYQSYLNLNKGEVWDCLFKFKAINQSGDIHEFSTNTLKIQSDELIETYVKFKVSKFDIEKGSIVKLKEGSPLFSSQLRVGEGYNEYNIVCNNFLLKINNTINYDDSLDDKMWDNPINQCLVLVISDSKFKLSQKFILKRKMDLPSVNITKPNLNKRINYGSTIEGTVINITNDTKQEIKILLDKNNLKSKLILQYSFIKELKFLTNGFWAQKTIELSPSVEVSGVKLTEVEGMYVIIIPVGKGAVINLKYEIDSYESLKSDKKINCEAAHADKIIGYKLLYPSEIDIYQIDKVNSSKELLLGVNNLIQKETFVFYEDPLTYNFHDKKLSCSKKELAKRFKKLYPGLPGNIGP